ncbi:phage minor head protein [Afifella sp. JA880]|uniref:endonuclease toxin domain-containing protein n=1 Tax=Afifella sp. JA880 TaxID=2975280 RepID=UPI0021BBAF78|nr:phage minor head protein [Afifella sp. JA880]MCT8266988.1 phage minor head protein [Afifella sp. JA880]
MLQVERALPEFKANHYAARLQLQALKTVHSVRRENLTKSFAEPAAARQRFAARLNAEIHRNAAMLRAAFVRAYAETRPGARRTPGRIDLPDVSWLKDETLAEWDRRQKAAERRLGSEPERRQAVLARVEDTLFRRFAGRLNEVQQHGLGIDRYVWRSRDDARVRPAHAENDDKVFFWEEPPEEGHPGEACNCRCWAEPVIEPIADDAAPPDTGLRYRLSLAAAAVAGVVEAVRDAVLDSVRSVGEAVEEVPAARRLVFLLRREARGELSDAERAELEGVRDAARARAETFFRDAPELAKALGAYLLALQKRPGLLEDAYRQGLATREEVEAAYRERAYVDTLVLLNVPPPFLALRAGKLLGLRNLAGDAKALAEAITREAARLRRRAGHVGHNVIDNPGIVWGRGIKGQGIPWEDALEATGQFGHRLPKNYKTIDFYDPVKRTATSAKTLYTRAAGYVEDPEKIYRALQRYVDRLESFDGDRKKGLSVKSSEIEVKRIELAVPMNTSRQQIVQIRRAVRYAEQHGVQLRVTFINEP